jgi:hypothetical protein
MRIKGLPNDIESIPKSHSVSSLSLSALHLVHLLTLVRSNFLKPSKRMEFVSTMTYFLQNLFQNSPREMLPEISLKVCQLVGSFHKAVGVEEMENMQEWVSAVKRWTEEVFEELGFNSVFYVMKFWERMAFLERASMQKEKGCKPKSDF